MKKTKEADETKETKERYGTFLPISSESALKIAFTFVSGAINLQPHGKAPSTKEEKSEARNALAAFRVSHAGSRASARIAAVALRQARRAQKQGR
jgi:hypothetical protein